MSKTYHLIIQGRVQGVGYRAWTVAHARELGLDGWVRNRTDGTVEAIVHGEDIAAKKMLADCYEGPPAARVTSIETCDWTGDVAPGFHSLATVSD